MKPIHTLIVLSVLMLCQLFFWYHTHPIKPVMTIVPDVPGKETVKALSFGDEQFYFRILALELQNAGDTFGRFTALKYYDYHKLYLWFTLLDTLDNTSNMIPALASYYYSQTQHTPDVRYIVDYLEQHTEGRPQKWWWLAQAVYLANHKLGDTDKALTLAYKLAKTPGNLPMWAKQMPAFIHEKRGEKAQALAIMQDLVENAKNLTPEELHFMYYFMKERLEKENIPIPSKNR